MEKSNQREEPAFREMSRSERVGTRGGICIFPLLLGKKAGEWLRERLRPE